MEDKFMELLMSRVPDGKVAPETLEFEAVVRRTLTGDSAAFEQVVLRYQRRVLALALRLLRTMDDAQDAAQEVFLRAFKYLHRFDPEKPVEPWLMRMTLNVCRDIGRKRQQRHHTFCEIAGPEVAPSEASKDDPFTGLATEQQRLMLWKILDGMPEKERLAVILRDVEGFSTSEVAAILGSSEGTVRSQICRGRLRIKDEMDRMSGGRT
jgi:RNA polymerase sigma-70 factor (ECF subfamily)